MTVACWTAALLVGLLWPARSFSAFDGIPLGGRAEAIVVGMVIPALWWLDRSILRGWPARGMIAALLVLKIGGLLLVQEGLCARFSTAAPLEGSILTIPVDEPRGVLRSWDVRADWRADEPTCTAIVDRPYRTTAEFPSWFLNVLDHLRPGRRDVSLRLTGAITVRNDGIFIVRTGEDMQVRGRIGSEDVSADGGGDIRTLLAQGTHSVALDASLTGDRWRFVPEWNGMPAWNSALLTIAPPRAAHGMVARAIAGLTTVLVVLLVALWTWMALARVSPGAWPLLWTAGASVVLMAAGITGRFDRVSSLLLVGSAWIPIVASKQNARSAFLMVGVPWLAYFAARAVPLIGHASVYSADDWLTYQVAGARIYMQGFWLEGGSRTFDYQALYRWISGALHVVFGDSSVGETYTDAACLVAGSLLAFCLVRPVSGLRAALLACAGSLATFGLGTIWYFVGRGLSEIAAAGFGFGAAFLLIRARTGPTRLAAVAGLLAVLMFYARQNHLIFALSLTALLLPESTSMTWSALARGARARSALAATYAAVFAAGVALFAARTWWYTGAFSLLYGTSLTYNDTGLRLTTMFSVEPWRKVVHGLSALVLMNEPPRLDPRALLVAAGVLVSIGALCQLPRLRDVPASMVIVVLGAMASSFIAHTHAYPGRMSIHLVPLAASVAVIAVSRIVPGPSSVHAAAPAGASLVTSQHVRRGKGDGNG